MSLNQLFDRLAAFTPTELPVLSLYLNAQADQHGRDSFASFGPERVARPRQNLSITLTRSRKRRPRH